MLMRRLPVHLLLLGCSGLLLGMQGCFPPAGDVEDGPGRSLAKRSGLYRAAAPAEKGPAFRLPRDASGSLLAAELPPKAPPAVLRSPVRPMPPVVAMPKFAEPSLPLPAVTPGLPRMPEAVKKAPMGPELVQEEALEEAFPPLEVPQKHSFAAGKRINVPSLPSSLPPPLPVLGRQLPDRASLDDATMEVSTEAVLAAAMPRRSKPLAYQRTTTPDPYEHHLPLTVSLPEERSEPQSDVPRPPR
jgi:hypothetical protein